MGRQSTRASEHQSVIKAGEKVLMPGNEVIAQAALDAGCRFYAGYPITPQNEIIAYMAQHMPEAGGGVYPVGVGIGGNQYGPGASACGVRAMTSSSSPGISLMQEGFLILPGPSFRR